MTACCTFSGRKLNAGIDQLIKRRISSCCPQQSVAQRRLSDLTGRLKLFLFFQNVLNSSLLLICFSLLHFRNWYLLTKEYISSCFDTLLQSVGWTACAAVKILLFTVCVSWVQIQTQRHYKVRGVFETHKAAAEQEAMTAELAFKAQIILLLTSKRTTLTADGLPGAESWTLTYKVQLGGKTLEGKMTSQSVFCP